MATAPEIDVPSEIERLTEFGRKNAITITVTVIVLVLVVAVPATITGAKRRSADKALELLGSTTSLNQLQEIVDNYASTPSAPLALLQLAKEHYNTGNYPFAEEKYNDFRNAYGDHRLAAAAEHGLAHCAEAQGRTRQALNAFESFATRFPDHFLTTQALFGQGRCLEVLSQLQDARIIYETIIADDPDGIWKSRAKDALDRLNRKITEGNSTAQG